MDLSIFGYQFMQNAILSALLGGIACGTIGVFVVLMRLPFVGVAMSHAAFAGALLGIWLGFNPLISAFAFCLVSAAIIGPLADRGELSPETSLGVIFSFMLGIAFLFIGLMPGTKSAALDLLWGSILTNTWLSVPVFMLSLWTGASVTGANYQDLNRDWLLFIKDFRWNALLDLGLYKVIIPILTGYALISLAIGAIAYVLALIIVGYVKSKKR